MRTKQRLTGLKKWLYNGLCKGREMKAPGKDITDIARAEPRVFLAWYPSRPDSTGEMIPDPVNVCPGILVMPNPSKGQFMEEKRFDRYNEVRRPKELGQSLATSILLCVYEPGIRMPGFKETGDMDLMMEGTEEGLFTLYDWMDDLVVALLSERSIPGTDLFVDEESIAYSLYTDQSYVVDKRPLFCGFVNVEFGCYAEMTPQNAIDQYLL